jgi:hypothetical protein
MPAKRHIAIRIAQHDLDTIDQYAVENRLDRTAYLIKAGRQELDELALHERLDGIIEGLEALERYHRLST